MTSKEQWQQITALHRQNRLEEAQAGYRKIIRDDPSNAAAVHLLGMVLHQQGLTAEALDMLEKAIELGGDKPSLLSNTSKVHIDAGNFSKALELLERALRQDPEHFGSLFNQALALRQSERPAEGLNSIDRAAKQNPGDAKVHILRASLLFDSGRYEDNRAALRRAHELGARSEECLLGIAASYAHQNIRDSALEALAVLDKKKITNVDDVFQAALIYQKFGAWLDAIEYQDEVISRDPGHTEALLCRGLAYAMLGAPQPAIRDYRQVLSIDPSYHQVHSNLLGRMQYDVASSAQDILDAHENWARQHASVSAKPPHSFDNNHDRQRQLIVGWISPRFDSSLLGRFLPETVRNMPASEFSHVFYSSRKEVDSIPNSLLDLGSWRQVAELNDEDLAELICADRVDILIDLTGHNPGNRLIAISNRLAPIQISWMDYFSTTGIPAMDYWLSDVHLTPAGYEKFFTESLIRLPATRLCYSPPKFNVNPQRSKRSPNEIVFGSFNRLGKLVDEVIYAWVDIVNAVVSSRLVLKAFEFKDDRVLDYTRDRFKNAGLDLERLELRQASSYSQMLAEYADIDIALDPFPFTGCATTCDALWMGVPIITLGGDSVVSRQGLSILTNVNKSEWIATDSARYRDISIELADSILTRGFNRTELRQNMQNSAMCSVGAQSSALANALRAAWVCFCDESL